MSKYRIATFVAAFVLVMGVVVGVVSVRAQEGSTNVLSPLPAASAYQPNSSETHLADVYQKVTQSVVNISVAIDNGVNQGAGTGTGFVIDTDGHIVTNNHVVEDANYIQVTFVNGTILEAQLVGRDPDADLAVIKVDPSQIDLRPVTLADSDGVFVGQEVMAIGSPFGQDFTLTTGIVSALDRSLQNDNNFSIPHLIQTDAAINPGNSGGPLLNMEGEVIGVNTAILSESRSASGVGFSIPSNSVRRIAPYLIENGSYTHSWLGISGTDLMPAQAKEMNLSSDTRGVVVSDITGSGPAAKAGLQGSTSTIQTPFGELPVNGDVITAINDTPVTQMSDLIDYLDAHTMPGDAVTLHILRDGQSTTLTVTLAQRPQTQL